MANACSNVMKTLPWMLLVKSLLHTHNRRFPQLLLLLTANLLLSTLLSDNLHCNIINNEHTTHSGDMYALQNSDGRSSHVSPPLIPIMLCLQCACQYQYKDSSN
jgi:hypothetical protein